MPGVSFLGSQAVASAALVSQSQPPYAFSGSTANTKGAWVQLIASTPHPTAWVMVEIPRAGSVGEFLVDIGVGGAGSEVVAIANIPYSVNSFTSPTATIALFPCSFPAGARISFRAQSPITDADINVQVHCFAPIAGGETGLGQTETNGAITATSLGTSVDPGGTANTKGAWVELVASTSFPYRWVVAVFTHADTSATPIIWAVDIGIGAAASEVVIAADFSMSLGSSADAIAEGTRSFPGSIPAGSRIAVRAQSDVNTAVARLLQAVLIGVG